MKTDRADKIVVEITKSLKMQRQMRGLSHGALASLVGVSRPAISHIENGKRRPSLLLALKIACVLKISLADLLQEVEKKYPCPA